MLRGWTVTSIYLLMVVVKRLGEIAILFGRGDREEIRSWGGDERFLYRPR